MLAFGLLGWMFTVALFLSLFPVKQKDSMFGMIVRRSRWILLTMVLLVIGFWGAFIAFDTLNH